MFQLKHKKLPSGDIKSTKQSYRVKTQLNHRFCQYIQAESLARGPKLLSIKNYVIELMA